MTFRIRFQISFCTNLCCPFWQKFSPIFTSTPFPTLLLILTFYTFLVSQQAIFHRILILSLSRKYCVVLLLWSVFVVFVVFVVVCNGCIVYTGCILTLNSTKIRSAFSFLRKQFYTPLNPHKSAVHFGKGCFKVYLLHNGGVSCTASSKTCDINSADPPYDVLQIHSHRHTQILYKYR